MRTEYDKKLIEKLIAENKAVRSELNHVKDLLNYQCGFNKKAFLFGGAFCLVISTIFNMIG